MAKKIVLLNTNSSVLSVQDCYKADTERNSARTLNINFSVRRTAVSVRSVQQVQLVHT